MWQDMILYWAWRGGVPDSGLPPVPSEKRIEYVEVVGPGRYLNGPNQGEMIRMRLAVTVFDGEVPTEINRTELAWMEAHGGFVEWPSARNKEGADMKLPKKGETHGGPKRSCKELAAEFGVPVATLCASLRAAGAPQPTLRCRGAVRNTWYDPVEVRAWWAKRLADAAS